jgi:hypothetical protein
MTKLPGIDHLNDYDLLNWILEQEFPWRDAVTELCNPTSLQELVDYVRVNYKLIKQLGNEKPRSRRKYKFKTPQ